MTTPSYAYPTTTPPPVYSVSPAALPSKPGDRPPVLTSEDRARIRAAARRVTELHPGPLGELCARELTAWEEFGYRIGPGTNGLLPRLVAHILAAPLPEPPAPAVPAAKPRVTARMAFPGIRRPA